MPVDDRWSKLSMRDRADLIKIYTKHGVTDLNEIRRHYNSFQDPVFEDRSKPKADLYNRLVDEKDNRRVDFENGSYGTHLMSSANVDNKPIVFSQIQPDDNGNLKDYGDKALDRAIERGDTIQFSNDDEARWWAENNYKQFYNKASKAYDEYRREKLKEKYPFYNTKVMNVRANGGHLFAYGTDGDTPFEQMLRERERQKSIQQTSALFNGTDTRNRTIAQKQQELFPNGVPQRSNAVVYDTDKKRIQEARKHNNDTNGKTWTADVNSEEYQAMKSIPSKVVYDITHPANILDRESTALMNFNPGVLAINSAIGARDAYNWGDYGKAALLGGLSFASGLGLRTLPRISGGYAKHTELPDFYNPITGRYEGYKKPSTKLFDVLPWNEFFDKNAETLRPNKFGEFTSQRGNPNTAITPDIIYMDPVERIINNAQNIKLIEDYPLVFSHSIGNRYLKELFNSKHGSFIMPSVSNRRPYGNGASGLTTLFFDNGLLTDFPHQSFIGDGQTNMLWTGFNMDDFSNMTLDEINQLIESTPNIRDYIKSVAMPTNDETMLLNGRIYDYKLPVNDELFVNDNIDKKLIDDNIKTGLSNPYDEVKFYAGIPFDRVKYAFTQDPEIDELLYKKGVHTNFDIDYHNPAYNDINEYRKYILGIDPTIRYKYGGHLFQYGGNRNNPPKRISSLLDPDKVRNRLPADASKYLGLDPFGITNTITAGLQYIFNNDNTVQDKLNERYELLRKTDDDWKAYHKKLKKSGHNVVDWKTTKRRLLDLANDYIGLEDAKDIYLNTPQRSNTFYPSKERPTIGNIENVWASNYLSSPTVVEDYILPAIRNIRTKNTVKNAQGAPLGSIEKIGKSGKNGVSFLPILGHATVGYGTDPYRGSYVSYYDKWDVNMGGKKGGADVVKYILGGTPVNIYDRVYLDDYYGYNSVNDYKNSKKEDPDITYGGWLPEVDISASVKSDGGQLGHITPYGQWEYPHQVTTIPSNNITMQGVDYPVVGVSDTGDKKLMLPGLDYLYDGNYVTEYPILYSNKK